mgnify:CR=1 FL=1
MFRRPGTFFDILHARSGQTPGADAAPPPSRGRGIVAAPPHGRRAVARPPPHTPGRTAVRGARCTATEYAVAYYATAVGGSAGGGAARAAACAVKKGVYLRQAKSADVVCM